MRYAVRCLDRDGGIVADDPAAAAALAAAHSCTDPVVDRAALRIHLGLPAADELSR